MPDAQNENNKGVVFDVVDDAVVANADTEFAFAPGELNSAGRSRCEREGFDGACDSFPLHGMNSAEGFRGRWFIGDRVRHGRAELRGSEFQFRHEVLVRDAAALASGVRCVANVGLILQGFYRAVEELG